MLIVRCFCLLLIITNGIIAHSQTPPYSGTIFINSSIITPSDPSSVVSTSYIGEGMVTVYDRRASDWVTINAYLFDVVWDDGLTSEAQVNSEFGSDSLAKIEAEKYAFLIGQLPNCLRQDVDEIWIHKGVEPFGGGNNSILIHTGQSDLYEKDGIIEETLVHEASHTSLDADHANAPGWIMAQQSDINYISTYARDNPIREDIAESFLTWLAVKYRQNSISVQDYNTITTTIPSRISYFDNLGLDLYPFQGNTLNIVSLEEETFKIYPNPSLDYIYIDHANFFNKGVKIHSLLGQDLTYLISRGDNKIDISLLPEGTYIMSVEGRGSKLLSHY